MILPFLLWTASAPVALPATLADESSITPSVATATLAHVDDMQTPTSPTSLSRRSPHTYYWHDHERGWFWYQEPPSLDSPRPQELPVPALQDEEVLQSPVQELQAFTSRLEQSLARAVLNPSSENLRHYMELNAKIIAMARDFAVGWQRLLWRSPALDSRLAMPTAGVAVQAVNEARVRRRETLLQNMAKEWGLWLFFRGDCPVCHRFAPVLGQFAARHGFTVLAISLDGGHLPGFPEARMDHQAAARLDVVTVPALYLVAPGQREIVPVGYGYMSAGELGRRLVTLVMEPSP